MAGDRLAKKELREAMNRSIIRDPINNTLLWEWNNRTGRERLGEGYETFHNDPPVSSAYPSERILVVGSDAEVKKLGSIFESIKDPGKEINYCSRMENFWKTFFNKKNYADGLDGRSIPKEIITTYGIMCYGYGYALDIYERLNEIANNWNVKVNFIGDFDTLGPAD